jgi:energy-coupling factor transporter ATP-binding protein EcfA2
VKLAHRATKYLITGASGTGKSTFARRLALNSLGDGKYGRLVVFDHDGEFSLRSGIEPAYDTEALVRQYTETHIAVYDPSEMYPGDSDTAWDFWCDWVFECGHCYDGITLGYCDEIQLFVGTDNLSQQFQQLVETGRRWGIDFIAISQQYNLVHNRLRNQTSHLVSFRQRDARVFQALEERGILQSDVEGLPDGHWVMKTDKSDILEKGAIVLDNCAEICSSHDSNDEKSSENETTQNETVENERD